MFDIASCLQFLCGKLNVQITASIDLIFFAKHTAEHVLHDITMNNVKCDETHTTSP